MRRKRESGVGGALVVIGGFAVAPGGGGAPWADVVGSRRGDPSRNAQFWGVCRGETSRNAHFSSAARGSAVGSLRASRRAWVMGWGDRPTGDRARVVGYSHHIIAGAQLGGSAKMSLVNNGCVDLGFDGHGRRGRRETPRPIACPSSVRAHCWCAGCAHTRRLRPPPCGSKWAWEPPSCPFRRPFRLVNSGVLFEGGGVVRS